MATAKVSIEAERALERFEAAERGFTPRRLKLWLVGALVLAFYVASWQLAQVDLGRLVSGLPRLGQWLAQAWPPKLDELPVFLERTAETVAMAAIGTTLATLAAIPMAVLASRNITARAPWIICRCSRSLPRGVLEPDGMRTVAYLSSLIAQLRPFVEKVAAVFGVKL